MSSKFIILLIEFPLINFAINIACKIIKSKKNFKIDALLERA